MDTELDANPEGQAGQSEVLRSRCPPSQAAPLRVVGPFVRRRDPVGGVGIPQAVQTRNPENDRNADGPKGRNVEVGWHGQKRSNDTHVSTTDPEAVWRASRISQWCRAVA